MFRKEIHSNNYFFTNSKNNKILRVKIGLNKFWLMPYEDFQPNRITNT